MAGSAVNLSGMLSQMAQDVGSQGGSVGRALFNPMLEMQADERRKDAIIEGELRQQREAERQRLAQLERAQIEARAISEPNMLAQQAIAGDDAQTLQTAANRLQEAASMNPNAGGLSKAAEYQGQVADVKVKGAIKGVNAIDNALKQFDAGAVGPNGMPIVSSQAAEMLTARRNSLLREDGVAEAYKAQLDAQAAATAKVETAKLDTKIKQANLEIKEGEANVQKYAGAVIQGASIDQVPPEHKAAVQKTVTGYKQDIQTESEIMTKGQALPTSVNDWASKSEDPIVAEAANRLKSGTQLPGQEMADRATVKAAWKAQESYRVSHERELQEKVASASSQIRITDALDSSTTQFNWDAKDILEELSEVDKDDRSKHPLWKKYMAISEMYPEDTPAELGARILGNVSQEVAGKPIPSVFPEGSVWMADGRIRLPDNRIATPPGWKG